MRRFKASGGRPGSLFSVQLLQKIFLGGFCALIFTLFYYQIAKGDYYFQRAKNNYVRAIPIRAVRGAILDKNNVVLAYDKAAFNISVIPHQIKKRKDSLFKEISEFLGKEPDSLYKNYSKNLKSYFSPVDIVINTDKITALKLKEKFEDAVLINPRPIRYYPQAYEFAHLLGYVKEAASLYEKLKKYGYTPLQRTGFSGIEQYYDAYLNGEDGGDLVEVNAKGKVVGFLGERAPKKGKNIYLTVDSRVQKRARGCLGKKRGVIIFMDSYSGEIIASYSNPSFDPNCFIEGKNINIFLKDKNSPLLNRAIQASYPIGSTFKPILGLAALEEKKLSPFKTYTCSGRISLKDTQFRCWSIHSKQNLLDALAHSCNVYFYNLGLLAGPNAISRWAKKFGLDSFTGIDLPYEKKGFIPTVRWKQKTLRRNWFAGDTLNFSIGQGFMETTPLEITTAINAFANGGCLVTPHLIKKIDNIESGISAKTPIDINSENLKIIKMGLHNTVLLKEGTAHKLKQLNLGLCGKTGTAQTKGNSHGWFIGFFPYRETSYTICVFLENGGSSHEAVDVVYRFLKKIKEDNLL